MVSPKAKQNHLHYEDSPGLDDLGYARDKVEQLRVTQGLEMEQKENRKKKMVGSILDTLNGKVNDHPVGRNMGDTTKPSN